MFTTKEVAEKLGYPHGTIRRYIARGLLKAIKRGHDNMIAESEIERFDQEHKRKPRKKQKEE